MPIPGLIGNLVGKYSYRIRLCERRLTTVQMPTLLSSVMLSSTTRFSYSRIRAM